MVDGYEGKLARATEMSNKALQIIEIVHTSEVKCK